MPNNETLISEPVGKVISECWKCVFSHGSIFWKALAFFAIQLMKKELAVLCCAGWRQIVLSACWGCRTNRLRVHSITFVHFTPAFFWFGFWFGYYFGFAHRSIMHVWAVVALAFGEPNEVWHKFFCVVNRELWEVKNWLNRDICRRISMVDV